MPHEPVAAPAHEGRGALGLRAALQVRHQQVSSRLKEPSSTVMPHTLEEDTMTQSTFPPPPPGVQQPYGQQSYGQPAYGQPGFGGPGTPYGQQNPGFGYQQPPKKKTGLIVGSLVGAFILIGGLVVGALFLFGSKTIDQADAQREVTQLGEQLLGAAPEGVSCPADVEVKSGGTFSCSAT